jgi:hypothetical protein
MGTRMNDKPALWLMSLAAGGSDIFGGEENRSLTIEERLQELPIRCIIGALEDVRLSAVRHDYALDRPSMTKNWKRQCRLSRERQG